MSLHNAIKRKAELTDSPKRKKARTSASENAEFQTVRSSVVLTIPPVFASDFEKGALEMLDSMIMRCVAVNFLLLS
jgi:DNA-directed RNA polymerase I subunit RPA43